MRVQAALDQYAQQCGPARVGQHLAVIRRYIAWGGTGDPADWPTYIEWLRHHEGLADSTVGYHQRILRSFFRINGLTVPRTIPLERADMGTRNAFAPAWIRAAVQVVRREGADPMNRWVLLLATVYGLRASEIAAVRPGDVEDARLFVRTRKHGEARWQWFPPALQPYRHPGMHEDAPQRPILSVARVHRALKQIAHQADLPMVAGTDVHGIRRAMVAGLMERGVPEVAIGQFLRWKANGKDSLYRQIARYAQPTGVIGGAADAPTQAGAEADDARVWAAHPFLAYWTDERT